MLFRKPRIVIVATICLLLFTLVQPVGAEEKAEGKGEGEGEGKKGAAPLSKDQREFNEKTQRLNSLGTRIEESDKQFKELVQHKQHEKDQKEIERIIKQMNEVVKDRNKSAEEYNRLKSEIAQRYPNQGLPVNRRYETQGKKTVEEMEGAAGLDELLTRTKKIIDKKFATFEDPNAPKVAAPPHAPKPGEEKPERLRLEK